ncbi:MAG: chemotaxis protein CheW [Candidatus Saganbacteria bacterium]|nr:chemotaxis protein CheW [Candidatus Saganbacteria bacterium]
MPFGPASKNMSEDNINQESNTTTGPEKEEGKEQLLFCTIGGLPFASSFSYIKEVINLTSSIVSVPNVPPHVSGIINLQGNIFAILNLAKFSSKPEALKSAFRHILVIHNKRIEAGLLIDDVPSIVSVSTDEILPLSDFQKCLPAGEEDSLINFVTREIKFNKRIHGLLDTEKILNTRLKNESEE